MAMNPSEALDRFIKNNRRFLKIKDGEEFRGTYHGAKVATVMSFGEEKEAVLYQLKEEGTDRIVSWQNSSTRVAELMKDVPVGANIVIRRSGASAKDTKYEIVPGEN